MKHILQCIDDKEFKEFVEGIKAKSVNNNEEELLYSFVIKTRNEMILQLEHTEDLKKYMDQLLSLIEIENNSTDRADTLYLNFYLKLLLELETIYELHKMSALKETA